MKIVATSDLHGHLIDIPPCDLLLIAGDLCPAGDVNYLRYWLQEHFSAWVRKIEDRGTKVIYTAGNHDFPFEENPYLKVAGTYLQDRGTEVDGLKVYGTPYQPRFFDWSFNLDEPQLYNKFVKIPENIDILITHGPPASILDLTPDGRHVGSISLREIVLDRKPKIHIFGHIHHSYGNVEYNGTKFYNVSLCTESYKPNNPLVIFEV